MARSPSRRNRKRWRHWVLCLALVVGGVVTVRPGLAQISSGSWSTAAPMPTPRWALAAATGRDGRIYAIGGLGAGGQALNTVESYDPSTTTWKTLAAMPTARGSLAAATGPDGRIYAIGGSAGVRTLNTVEAYTPSTNSWNAVAPLPTARDVLAAATGQDGRIYAIGGRTGTNGSSNVPTVQAYTPSTNSWSTVAPMPPARGSLAASTGPDGRIYVMGGECDCSPPFLTTVEAYDPATNSWSTVAPMATGRYALAAATGLDGRIYAIGGCCGPALPFDTVEAYDPSANAWSTVAPLPTAREAPAAATGPDGRIYVIGGFDTATGAVLDTLEAYTPPVPSTAAQSPSPSATPTVSATPTPPAMPTNTPTPTATPSPTAVSPPAPTSRVTVVPAVSPVPGQPGAATASFTVTFPSTSPGQGEVYFGSGPGCLGLVEVATQDRHPGTTQHEVVVTGNDLPGTVGDNGIIPGVTYWFEAVTATESGVEIDDNGGACYSVTIPDPWLASIGFAGSL